MVKLLVNGMAGNCGYNGLHGWETEASMAVSDSAYREAIAAQAEQELRALEARGVWMAGNGYSPILAVKGRMGETERAGGELLGGADGEALRAALQAIGWAPEDFCALATCADGAAGSAPDADAVAPEATVAPDAVPAGEPLPTSLFREAVEALDPEAVVLLDDAAADAMREAYADALVQVEDFNAAMLQPGLVVPVLGRRVLALDGFEAALADAHKKQVVWAYLKQLTPLGAPY